MYEINQIFTNTYPPEVALWCNNNNCYVEELEPLDGERRFQILEIPPYIPTDEEIQKQLTDAVQQYMDETAQTRNYDNIHTACSYSNSTDEIFRAEGTACLAWRDSVWRACYDILAEVKAGTRAIPTVEELIAELPVLDWGDTTEETAVEAAQTVEEVEAITL